MKKTRSLYRRENRTGYIFIAPWVFGFCLFFLYPLGYSLVLAFSTIKNNATFELEFVWFKNFQDALTNDMEFMPNLRSSLLDLVNVPIAIIFSLFVATLLNRNLKGRGFFRAMFLLPVLLGTGAVMSAIQGNSSQVSLSLGGAAQEAASSAAVSFQDLVIGDQLETLLGSQLSGYVGAIVNRISSVMWLSGIQIIIFLGSLQTIPASLYEAAVVDGASEFDKLWKITLPMVMPAVLLNTIYTLIDSFTSSSNKVISYIQTVSFKNFLLSYGSALSWMYFVIVGVVIAVAFAVIRRFTFYQD